MTKFWVVRAGRGAEWVDDFLSKSVVAIGWDKVGPLTKYRDRDSLISKVLECWPEYKDRKAVVTASHLYRFANEIQQGDYVLTYHPGSRTHWLGKVKGPYEFNDSLIVQHPHIRKVEWEKGIERDSLSVPTKNRLGSIATLFLVAPSAADEVLSLARGDSPSVTIEPEEASDEDFIYEDILARSREFIKDKLNALDWDEMQEVVAGLLRAMGYKTKISPAGADRGRDILASPDGFGFEQPRIVVEVKHRNSAMGSQDIRSFLGGRHKDDKGLYVSTGGFTKDAIYEAERATIPVTLMDLDGLADGLLEHYERLDPEVRSTLPLRRIYWPA